MATLGKKFSSCVAVACVWVGGGVLAQLVYLGIVVTLTREQGIDFAPESGLRLWSGSALPLVVSGGGTLAVWILQRSSGWPRIGAPSLFVHSLIFSIFSLALMPARHLIWIAFAATVLGVAGAMVITWRAAAHGDLGTHIYPGASAKDPSQSGRS